MSMDIEQYLLPVGKADSLDKKNRVINKTYVTPSVNIMVGTQYACLTCEYKRVLYILQHVGETIRIQKLNMINNKLDWIGDFSWTLFGNSYFGDIKVDDNYIYIKPSSNGNNLPLYIVDLSTLNVSSYTMTGITYAYGRIEWYDNKTLLMQYNNGGYALFDTSLKLFSYVSSQNSNTVRGDFAYGNGYALSSYYLSYNVLYKHSFKDNTYSTIALESSTTSKICFCKDDGLFYIIQTSKMYTWNPSTQKLSTSIVMPWGVPQSVNVENGVLYMTQSNSNVAYMYDIIKNKYWRILLPFTCCNIETSSVYSMCRPSVLKSYWFIPNNTLYQIHYTKNDKYKLGNKYDRTVFLFDDTQESSYEFDNRFIKFESSHLTIHDGVINKPLNVITNDTGEETNFKKISINKKEYNKFKKLKFIFKET